MEAKLISGIVERTGALLPFRTNNQPKLGDLKQNSDALIRLSRSHLSSVIEGLLHLHAGINNSNPGDSLPNQQRIAESKLIIYQLLSRALSAAIRDKKLDLHFDDDFLADFDDEDDAKLDDKEIADDSSQASDEASENTQSDGGGATPDSPLPSAPVVTVSMFAILTQPANTDLPQLDDQLAHSLLKYLCDTLFKPQPFLQTALLRTAARVMFKLSVVSFDAVFARIDRSLRTMKTDESTDLTVFKMMEYMNFDSAQLSRLLTLLCDVAPKFKKNSYHSLAKPLHQAVWNWITNFPKQFVTLCQTKTTLPGKPDRLFDIFETWSGSKKERKALLWPVQTMLLLLCPDILSNVVMAVKQGLREDKTKKVSETYCKFLDSLLKALRGKEKTLTDVAVVCFVDVYKASTFVSKSDMSALRFLVPDVQNHLQERLMNAENPIKTESGAIDVRLIVDFLVSSFRLNQRHVTSYVLPILFKHPPVFKLVLAKSMLRLAQEGKALPWHPTLAVSYTFLSKPVRALFQELLQEDRFEHEVISSGGVRNLIRENVKKVVGGGTPPAAGGVAGGSKPEASYMTDTLLALLALFHTDPKLVLENTSPTPAQHISEIHAFFGGLCNCLRDTYDVQIQQQATRLLLKLFELRYIEQWCPQDMANGFVEISSSVLSQFAVLLVSDKELKGDQTIKLLSLTKQLIASSNEFLALHHDLFIEEQLAHRKRIQAIENTEIALLVLLCSTDNTIWATAASCFGDLCGQIDILGEKESKANSIVANYMLYRQLSSVEELGKGRASQQKKIRKLLKRVEIQTKANITAFLEVYTRWKNYTLAISNTSAEDDARNRSKSIATSTQRTSTGSSTSSSEGGEEVDMSKVKATWRNYTTFLCALGGVCIQTPESALYQDNNVNSLTDELIRDLMRLVTCEVSYVREMVTATIGTDLSPALYESLFQNLHLTVARFFGDQGQLNMTDASTLFVDQSITIVKNIMENEASEGGDLSQADFESLVLSFVRYCSLLPTNADSVRIKCKLCILVELLMTKRKDITFRSEVKFRTEVLQQVMEWTSDFATQSDVNVVGTSQISGSVTGSPSSAIAISGSNAASGDSSSTATGQRLGQSSMNMTLFKDLDVLCMRAISGLLNGLSVTDEKTVVSKGKDKDSSAAEEGKEFFKYFSFLSRYLSRSDQKDVHPSLREFTINALGNLLAANINYGLEVFMKMAYTDRDEDRAAFLTVLSGILKEGIRISEKSEEEEEKYDRLIKVLEEEHFSVVFALCSAISIQEQDEVCAALIKIFYRANKALDLLKVAIQREVDSTATSSTLFRANSTASKLLSAYSKLVGTAYLHQTLCPVVNDVSAQPGNFEVDATRVPADQKLENNFAHLSALSQRFLDAIFDSISECPRSFHEICSYLNSTVERKFPADKDGLDVLTSAQIAEGNFIFLRFFCPAIVTPHIYGVVPTLPAPDVRRCLLLVAKVLTNTANGSFSKKEQDSVRKEEYMKPFDPFGLSNLEKIRSFFNDIATLSDTKSETRAEVPDEEREEGLISMHRYLFEYREKMPQALASLPDISPLILGDNESKSSNVTPVLPPTTLRVSLSETLATVLGDLGKPPDNKRRAMEAPSSSEGEFTSTLFEEFMKRMASKDTSALEDKGLFYEGGVSIAGRPVLYYIARRFDEEDDPDLVLMHVLKTMQRIFHKPYEVVFDSTMWEKEHDQTLSWFTKLHKLLPKGAKKNLKMVYVVNPNSHFKQQAKQVARFIDKKKAQQKVVFVTNLAVELFAKYIDENEAHLPDETMAIERAAKTTFSPASRVIAHSSPKEALLRLSETKLYVITLNDQILHHVTNRIDFIVNGSISEVALIPSQRSSEYDEVLIRYGWPAKDLLIRTPMKDQLIQALKSAVARERRAYRFAAKQSGKRNQRIRPSDIPGYVLNMCFLNLVARSPGTRVAAYNLLAVLAEQFRFNIFGDLLEIDGQGMCIPSNTVDLVIHFSTELARSRRHITMQFLKEAISGLNIVALKDSDPKSSQGGGGAQGTAFAVIKYIRPWLRNIPLEIANTTAAEERQERFDRIKEWLGSLIETTVLSRSREIHSALLTEIWSDISADEQLVDAAMDIIIQRATEAGISSVGSTQAEALTDLCVSLADKQATRVASKVIEALTNLLEKEVQNATEPIEQQTPWAKAIIHTRILLMLSFQNKLAVSDHLPRLFHLITLLVGRGSTYLRSSVLSLTINIVHSMCMSGALCPPLTPEQRKLMRTVLSQLQKTSRFKLIFLGSTMGTVDPFIRPVSKEKKKLEELDMWGVENLASFFIDVIKTAAGVANLSMASGSGPALSWYTTWISTCRNTAINGNLTHLPRVLAVYGALSRAHEAEEMLSFSFNALKTSLESYSPLGDVDLPVAVLLSLGQFAVKLAPISTIFYRMFALPLMLLPAADEKLFPAVVHLFECVLHGLETCPTFRDATSVEHFWQRHVMHDESTKQLVERLEHATGISFQTSFSFAISCLLMKGITSSVTKTATLQLLNSLHNLSMRISNTGTQDYLGYLTALVPFNTTEGFQHLRDSVLGVNKPLFVPENFRTPESAVLFTRYLLTVVNNIELENERVVIYEVLQHAFQSLPDVFRPLFKQVLGKVITVYNGAQSSKVAEVALALIKTIMADPSSVESSASTTTAAPDVPEFCGMANIGSFKVLPEAVKKECTAVSLNFLTNLVALKKQAPIPPTKKQSPDNLSE